MNVGTQLARSYDVSIAVRAIYRQRCENALNKFGKKASSLMGADDQKPRTTALAGMMDPVGQWTKPLAHRLYRSTVRKSATTLLG
jgi:hypothetical protein